MDLQIVLEKKLQELALWCEKNKIWVTITREEEKKPRTDKIKTIFMASIKRMRDSP